MQATSCSVTVDVSANGALSAVGASQRSRMARAHKDKRALTAGSGSGAASALGCTTGDLVSFFSPHAPDGSSDLTFERLKSPSSAPVTSPSLPPPLPPALEVPRPVPVPVAPSSRSSSPRARLASRPAPSAARPTPSPLRCGLSRWGSWSEELTLSTRRSASVTGRSAPPKPTTNPT